MSGAAAAAGDAASAAAGAADGAAAAAASARIVGRVARSRRRCAVAVGRPRWPTGAVDQPPVPPEPPEKGTHEKRGDQRGGDQALSHKQVLATGCSLTPRKLVPYSHACTCSYKRREAPRGKESRAPRGKESHASAAAAGSRAVGARCDPRGRDGLGLQRLQLQWPLPSVCVERCKIKTCPERRRALCSLPLARWTKRREVVGQRRRGPPWQPVAGGNKRAGVKRECVF